MTTPKVKQMESSSQADEKPSQQKSLTILAELMRFVRPYRWRVAAALAALIVTATLTLYGFFFFFFLFLNCIDICYIFFRIRCNSLFCFIWAFLILF